MKNIKAFLEHEVLNLLTLINMIIATEDGVALDKKEEIADLIKLSSLLISNESFFEEAKKKAFIEEVNLQEIVDIAILMHEVSCDEKDIKTSCFDEIVLIKTDKNILKELLDVLMRRLVEKSTSIRFAFRKMERKLVIFYEGPSIDLEQKNPLELMRSSASVSEILFHLNLNFALSIGIEIKQKDGKIEIYFPKAK